jgi:hypothetical protein
MNTEAVQNTWNQDFVAGFSIHNLNQLCYHHTFNKLGFLKSTLILFYKPIHQHCFVFVEKFYF